MTYKHLLFDMDNTLYPASSDMDKGITRRMLECVADFFHCDMEKAIQLRAERIIHYSTTLEWLRAEGMNDIEGFLAHVHPDNEADELTEQPALREFLISLNMPMSILTNAPHEHADRVLGKLGVADLFEAENKTQKDITYIKAYGNSNEVENTLDYIFTNNIPLDDCVIAATNSAKYNQLLLEYSQKYDLPMTFSNGISINNTSAQVFCANTITSNCNAPILTI